MGTFYQKPDMPGIIKDSIYSSCAMPIFLRSPVVPGVDFFDGLPHSQTFHLEFIYLYTLCLIKIFIWYIKTQ